MQRIAFLIAVAAAVLLLPRHAQAIEDCGQCGKVFALTRSIRLGEESALGLSAHISQSGAGGSIRYSQTFQFGGGALTPYGNLSYFRGPAGGPDAVGADVGLAAHTRLGSGPGALQLNADAHLSSPLAETPAPPTFFLTAGALLPFPGTGFALQAGAALIAPPDAEPSADFSVRGTLHF